MKKTTTPDAMREALEKIANSKREWIKEGVGYVEPITRFAERLKSIAQVALVAPEASHSEDSPIQPIYRHKKRGTTYQVIGYAQVQCESPLTEYEIVTVYKPEVGPLDDEHGLWVRRMSEFEDTASCRTGK